MRVFYSHYEYDMYVNELGIWTLHVFDNAREEGERWVETYHNVSVRDPFASYVQYNAWR